MKGSINNRKEVEAASHAGDRGGKAFIRFKKGKQFIRILGIDFVSEHEHSFYAGKKFYSFVDPSGKAYSPDDCLVCNVAKEKFWDKIAEIKENPNWEKSNKLKGEVELLKKKGKELITKLSYRFVAIYGEAIKVKNGKTGKIDYEAEWEKEAKILSLSKPQFDKLTKGLPEKYPSLFPTDDDTEEVDFSSITERDLLFVKEAPKGEETKTNTPIDIVVSSSRKNDTPEYENELPDIEKSYRYLEEKEIKKIMDEFLGNDDDFEEADDLEKDDEDKDFDDNNEEEAGHDDDADFEDVDDDFEDDEKPEFARKNMKAKSKPVTKSKSKSKKK